MSKKALILVDFENEWIDQKLDRKTHESIIHDLKATRPEVKFIRLGSFHP